MAEIKLTKNELRAQQNKLAQLKKYLPTLQLKKAMLQLEVSDARAEITRCEEDYTKRKDTVEHFSGLLVERTSVDPMVVAKMTEVKRRYENIAGVEVPYFESVAFTPLHYNLFETQPWVDSAILELRALAEAKVKIQIAEEKKAALEKELREVSIRVNLFEKILIPRALGNIKKIKVFLGDQQLAAVSQAKVAKAKIIAHKLKKKLERILLQGACNA